MDRILRLSEVIQLTGLGRSTIYEWMSNGRFPKAISLGARAVGWRQSDLNDWLESRETRGA